LGTVGKNLKDQSQCRAVLPHSGAVDCSLAGMFASQKILTSVDELYS